MLDVFGCLLLFVALHCNVLLLSVLFPVIMMDVVFFPALLVMSVDPRCQVMVGAGTAFLLTTHWITFWISSLIVSGLSSGIKDTFLTSTADQCGIIQLWTSLLVDGYMGPCQVILNKDTKSDIHLALDWSISLCVSEVDIT